MAAVVVLGGSVAGLSTALMLDRAGHDVTVVERDEPGPPTKTAAVSEWNRPSTPQLPHSHVLVAGGARVLRGELPEVYEDLVSNGANIVSSFDFLPPGIADRESRDGIDQVQPMCVRRPVIDWALGRAVETSGVRVVRSMARGLLVQEGTVTGVQTDAGPVPAEVVIDASGRRSRVPRWLAEAGTPLEETRSPCGCVYLTQAFSLGGGAAPGRLMSGFGAFQPAGNLAGLVFAGDEDTFTVSLQLHVEDPEMLVACREPGAFQAVALAMPVLRPWVEAGTPLGPVHVMAGLDNTSRRLVRDGTPIVGGLLQVGDSAATTNPALGRGMSLALLGAQLVRDVVSEVAAADRLPALTERRAAELDPFVLESWGVDERSLARNRRVLNGTADPELPSRALPEEAMALAMTDRQTWERLLRKNQLLELPSTLYAEGDLEERVLALRGQPPPGPAVVLTRQDCLDAARSAVPA